MYTRIETRTHFFIRLKNIRLYILYEMEPQLDEIITIKDKEKKYNMPYFNYRICCNHNVNGELELLKSIVKNTPKACIFDVGATGSPFPDEINKDMCLHLFDPDFKPSGKNWGNTMFKKEVNYDAENVFVNKSALNDTDNTLYEYCTKKDISHINFLKIDTDGHDLGVLKGLKDITVDMVQFEYDNFYRNNNIDINDMFKMLPEWHFFYILPSGLIPIEKMRDDYIYTNIFASKKYPTDIIKDFKLILQNNIIETEHVGEFVLGIYWEVTQFTPDIFKYNYCIDLDKPDMTYKNFSVEQAFERYNSIYDK